MSSALRWGMTMGLQQQGALLGIMRKEWGVEDAHDMFEEDVPAVVS
jgi:hypothetical protein